ncbi:MAG: DeoR/GlpR transcriptional regulator [Chloroflexi bacterium]|nr:DeoR/GlpR transcriptional regulator [Chloroflexota bacterium]
MAQLTEERQREIVEFVRVRQRATVAELSRRFDVSEATIRRDLEKLHSLGLIQRVHGGAMSVPQAAPEPPVLQRLHEQHGEKQRIGRAAAALVRDGETIFLGSGTTTLEVARALHGRRGLTVITNALSIANELAEDPDIELIILGGTFRRSELSMIGHLTEQALKELRADKVIMGIRAIHPEHGLTNDYVPETMTDRAIIRSGQELIIVADHTKFGRVSTAFVAPITAATCIITDGDVDPEMVAQIEALGVRVTKT